MFGEKDQKVTGEHLQREAYLYVRQSTIRQVHENAESTERQYALQRRAIALGWESDRVQVIDCDLGQSAAGNSDREGFKRLVSEVGMGRAGIVMGLEVSRLARKCSDWHRLLEICALTNTLILDEDGLYDPRTFNDRLVLGLKGAMSEAEIWVIRSRLQGGILNKAQRGELKVPLPTGLIYDEQDTVVLDPDAQIQESIRVFFDTFWRVGSAHSTVKAFREEGLTFPRRIRHGPCKGTVVWKPLTDGRVTEVLHNPRYAGAFCYGRRQITVTGDAGRAVRVMPREEWIVLIPGAHEGYISWEDYERIQKRLEENAAAQPARRKRIPREGPALLQGLSVCGVCGRRMDVRYHHRRGSVQPDYCCKGMGNVTAMPPCQSIPGDNIDKAIGELLLEVVSPVALEVSLSVQQEVEKRFEEADALRRKHVERARYEAESARHRYMKVDPDNRLVADTLEGQWNEKLRELRAAEEEYKRQQEEEHLVMDKEKKDRVVALARDFPMLWRDPKLPHRERKRMVGLIIEDVTLVKGEEVRVDVRFKGGATRTLKVPRTLAAWETWKTPPGVVVEIDRLLDDHTQGEVAAILNERGFASGQGRTFDGRRVGKTQRAYRLKTRRARLREAGWLSIKELADKLGICRSAVRWRRAHGRLPLDCRKVNDMGEFMYQLPAGEGTRDAAHLSARSEEV
ncbi:MAG: recombinase family protein [Armatimonadetes bacterium]|nr:recombinase family protein [Armatimonadota bacterium]